MTECAIVRLSKPAMARLLRDDNTFVQLVLSYVLTRNIRIEEDLVDQLFNSSESVWRASFFYWPILETKASPRRSSRMSARKPWPVWSAPPARG